NSEIQLTIQGQTISSNFGTLDSCQYNLEQLLSAGIVNKLFPVQGSSLSLSDQVTMQKLADLSFSAYQDFKNHPKFMPYLEEFSTLKYYAKTNISSRPAKRGNSDQLHFEDLRAIPFVGSWSQLKQNVPGFYGVGAAMQHFIDLGEFNKIEILFENSAFFRTLLENTMMSLTKSFFPLTAHIKDDPEYGIFWKMIYEEYLRTQEIILKLFGFKNLMENTRAIKASIDTREKIVLPLVTIQQYALQSLKNVKESSAQQVVYEKMITRTLFGNINASRNSA
ncbi:MAG: phosphoenolpyruvate carboxylase, partial [Candidatus Paceibacterota bacterium]